MKRMTDIFLAVASLVLLSPVLLAAALAVRLQGDGPVFFKQARIGVGCLPFGMYKFRTMVNNAASIGPYFTADSDPRITPVGRFLRRSSIDELPQLLNVVFGHMSVVGPRPDVPAQESLYNAADWQERHTVRPGITGLAQALFRSSATPEQRLEADLRYVRSHSLWMDLKIVAWTVQRLGGSGAN